MGILDFLSERSKETFKKVSNLKLGDEYGIHVYYKNW